MKRYRFRLAAVARVRAVEEQLAVAEMAKAQVGLAAAAAATKAAVARLAEVSTAGPPSQSGEEAAERRQVVSWRLDGASLARIDEQAAEQRLEEARAAYHRAHRRVVALQRLEERSRAEHAREAERAERTEVDQLVADRWGRAGS